MTTPPGPWRYDVEITNVGTGQTAVAGPLADTAFTPPSDLQANTSYRWAVTARLPGGESTRAASPGTFVIVDEGTPSATLLYQNFPNPFPATGTGAASAAQAAGGPGTCVWFDLGRQGTVRVTLYTLRGDRVRTLVPGPDIPGVLPAGRYGRAAEGNNAGCDPRLAWDGTTDDGRVVPAGVYLLRLEADGRSQVKKIVFRGR